MRAKKYDYNVGIWDQRVRYTIGILFPILGMGAKRSRWARAAFWAIGLDGLLTAYFKFSPLNKLLGISTYPKKRRLMFVVR